MGRGVFVRLFWILLWLGVFACCATSSLAQGAVYFLNVPESIRTPGTIHSTAVGAGERSRVFFHYCNKTGKDQKFTLDIEEEMGSLRTGIATAFFPGEAGTKGMNRFLADKPHKGKASLVTVVKRGWTVSGVVEGVSEKPSKIVATMGEGPLLSNIQYITSPYLFWQDVRPITHGETVKFRIGERIEGHIAGDYGSTIRVGVVQKAEKESVLTVSVSPRGGDLVFVYNYLGKILNTPTLRAKRDKKLFSRKVAPGETVTLDAFPIGGYNYPVEVIFRLGGV